MEDAIIPLAGCAMITAVVLGPFFFKNRERREMQLTVRHALDKGQDLPPDLVEAMAKAARGRIATAHTDLRAGVIWLAIAAGIACFGWGLSQDTGEGLRGALGFAAIPGFIGLAFVILSFFNKTKAEQS